jgi:small membrane protein
MIIKPFLSILLFGVLFFVMIQHHSGRLLRPAVAIAVAVGIFFTWMPEFSNKVANYLGIGRGADMIFYIWIVLSLLAFASLYITFNKQERQITHLTRALALYHSRDNQDRRPLI